MRLGLRTRRIPESRTRLGVMSASRLELSGGNVGHGGLGQDDDGSWARTEAYQSGEPGFPYTEEFPRLFMARSFAPCSRSRGSFSSMSLTSKKWERTGPSQLLIWGGRVPSRPRKAAAVPHICIANSKKNSRDRHMDITVLLLPLPVSTANETVAWALMGVFLKRQTKEKTESFRKIERSGNC